MLTECGGRGSACGWDPARWGGALARRGGVGRAPGRSCYGLVFEVEEFLERSVECYGEGEGELGGGGELPRLDA